VRYGLCYFAKRIAAAETLERVPGNFAQEPLEIVGNLLRYLRAQSGVGLLRASTDQAAS
jgi:hypothetical protein